MSKKSILMFVVLLIVLIMGISATSATNVSDNDTNAANVEDSHITSHTTTTEVVKEDNNIKTSNNITNTKKNLKTTTSTDKNAVKNNKNLKANPTTHIVNQDNWNTVFTSQGSSNIYYLNDSIANGDTIDFQGYIYINGTLTFNKTVNVETSTNDANISLNTHAGSLFGESSGNRFQVLAGAANSTFTGIKLYNTQFWVSNTTNVTFTNMSMIVSNQRVGSGVGQTAIRGSTFITLRNCYVYTENNGGSTSIALTLSDYCTVDNCTVVGVGEVGNLIYINPYNPPSGVTENNSYNNITNNKIFGEGSAISLGIVIGGSHNYISGNVGKLGIATAYATKGIQNSTIINNTVSYIVAIPNSYIANNTVSNSIGAANNSIIINNKAKSLTIAGVNVKVYNNIITENTTISTGNANVTENNLYNIILNNAKASETNITSNNITGSVIITKANKINISDNIIENNNDYTINIATSNNTITNNYLTASTQAGYITIISTGDNLIENNTPEPGNQYNITDDLYQDFFDEDGVFNATKSIGNYSTINLQGIFTNKNFTFSNIILTVNGINATLYNATITSTNDSKISLSNITINNGKNSKKAVILETDYNKVRDITIKHISKDTAQEIYVTGINNIIDNNKIIIYAPSTNIDWSTSPALSKVAGIIILSDKNMITDNIINVVATTTTGTGTVEAITIQGSAEQTADNNTVKNNKITVNGTDYAYGINMGENANHNIINSNIINMTSTNYASGIQVGYGTARSNNINSNKINITADNYAYGILINTYGVADVSGTAIISNSITVNANRVYLVEVYSSTKTSPINNVTINNNNLYGNGNHTIAIAFSGINSKISGNRIEINGTSNTTVTGTYDMIAPTTAGILVQDSNNISITGYNIHVVNGPGILFTNTTNTILNNSRSITSNNTGIVLVNSNNNTIVKNNANTTSKYAVTLTNSVNNTIVNNVFYSNNNSLGGDYSVESTGNNNITNNTPTIILLTNQTYSTLFNTDGIYSYTGDGDTLALASNLYGVDLIFNNTSINMVNTGNYTIYNGTIKFLSTDKIYSSFIGININNVNKSAIITDFENNVINSLTFTNASITVTGENITAIISDSQTQYRSTYLIFHDMNFTMKGTNVTLLHFIGIKLPTSFSGSLRMVNTTIDINAEDTARLFDIQNCSAAFIQNNLTIKGKNVIIINSDLGVFSDGLRYNNIIGEGDNVILLDYGNDLTGYTVQIRYNNITLSSNNPIHAINVINSTKIQLSNNTILINATNNGIPIITVTNGTNNQVTNNYIQAHDVAGNDAVEQTGIIINNNQPADGNYRVIINKNIPENTTINKYITIQANATDAYGNPITGTITITVDGETIISQPFVSTITAYYVPEEAGHKVITLTYTDSNGVYATTSTTSNLNVLLNNAVITIDPINTTINKTTPITVTVTGEDGRAVDKGTIEFTAYDTTVLGVANVTNGVATITITPTEIENTTIYAHYLGNELYNESTASTTYFVNNIKPTITVENMTTTSNATTINVKVVCENGTNVADGTVTITVNGDTYQGNVTNGSASVTIQASLLKTGNNILSINYDNIARYEPATTTYYINGTRYGSVYYVATNGSSSNDGRTPETPWNYTYAFNTIRNSTYNNSLIYILNGTYNINDTVVLNNGLTLKIIGNNSPVLNGNNKIINTFNIQNGLVSLESMTFKNFANTPILNRANNTNIIENTFLNNKGINGGAISNYNTNNATMANNVFQNNTGMYGGAIYNRGNNTIINKNTFTKNNASISSGAIYNLGRNTWITNNIFTNNHANTIGGAINNWETTKTTVTGNKFSGNQANYGGAIYYRGTGLKLNNNNMTSNTARVSGGAVFIIGNNNRILNNNFTANKARSGAAINNLGTNTNITGNIIKYNTANITGAAVNNWNARNATIVNNTIHHNQAQYGAIYIRGANSTVQSNNIYSNKASISGGAIFNIGINGTIYANTLRSNNAQNYGGAINNWNGVNTRITGNNITYNNATYGGAINTRAINTTITENIITRNSAVRGGAILDTRYTTTTMNNNTIKNNPTENGEEVTH